MPPDFRFRDEVESIIRVAPIPDGLQDAIEAALDKKPDGQPDSDIANLLSKDHLQFLHTRFLGVHGNIRTDGRRAVWIRGARAIQGPQALPKAPPNLSSTISESIKEYATSFSLMWSGKIFSQALDYLLRILLRIHLAPKRELKHKELKKAIAQRKEQAIAQRKQKARSDSGTMSRKAWQSKVKRLCDSMADNIEAHDIKTDANANNTEVDDTEAEHEYRDASILGLLMELQDNRPPPGIQQDLPKIYGQLQALSSQAESEDSMDVDIDYESGIEEDEDTDSEDDLESQGNNGCEPTGLCEIFPSLCSVSKFFFCNVDERIKEPSRAKLRSLQAVLKVLLESANIHEAIDRSWVKKTGFKDNKFTDEECDIVAMLANSLRPFIPKRRSGDDGNNSRPSLPHIALRIPIVLIANSVLRATGYTEFTRRIAPMISVSSLHALALGPVGVYEVLCSKSEGHFDIKDSNNAPLTLGQRITKTASLLA